MGQCLSVRLAEQDFEAAPLSKSEEQSSAPLSGIAGKSLGQNRSRLSNKLQQIRNSKFRQVDVSAREIEIGGISPCTPSEKKTPDTPSTFTSMSPETPKSTRSPSPLSSMISSFDNSAFTQFSPRTVYYTQNSSLSTTPCSFLLDGLDRVMIPEEVDPDAPSDEEDSYLRTMEESQDPNQISAWEMEPGPIVSSHRLSPEHVRRRRRRHTGSPTLMMGTTTSPMEAVKARYKNRVTRPTSIIRHHPHISPPPHTPLTAPPKEQPNAVDRQTLADFHRLKIQVKLQEKSVKQSKRLQKLEDRLGDVQTYRKLYKEFEDIQDAVSVHSQQSQDTEAALDRTESFDLKDSSGWFFDFDMVNRVGDLSDLEDEDDRSIVSQFSQQSNLSLLSESSMESQRMYFAAKKHSKKTKERIEKLENLLRQMNTRKGRSVGTGEVDAEVVSEDLVVDYGPQRRRGSISSQVSLASKTSIKSDYGPVKSDYDHVPTCVNARMDYGPAVRRGSATSLLSMTSCSANNFQPGHQLHVGPDDNGLQGHTSSEITLIENLTPKRKHSPQVDYLDIVGVADDLATTPQRSGNVSNDISPLSPILNEVEGPGSSNLEIRLEQSPQASTIQCPPFDLLTMKSFSTEVLVEEKKSDGTQNSDDRLPRWRDFSHLSSAPEMVKETSPQSDKPSNAPLEDSNIFSMSKEQFLQMADVQFEDVSIVRIDKVLSEEEDLVITARRLDFSAVDCDKKNVTVLV